MEAREKTFTSDRHHLSDDGRTMTSHRHHHHHLHRPLLRSSWLRSMVSAIVCLLLCVLVNPAVLQSPRTRSHFNLRHIPRSSSSEAAAAATAGRRTNASSSSPEVGAAGRAARFPLVPPTHPSTTTTTTTTRRSTLRKILEGEADDDLTLLRQTPQRRRRPTTTTVTVPAIQRPTNESGGGGGGGAQLNMMPIVARIRVEPVASGEFRRRLKMALSYRDVVRIFIRSDERLTDEDIDDFISSPLMTSPGDAETNVNAAAASQAIIVGSAGRQSVEDNRLPTNEWDMALNHFQEMESIGECRIPVPKFIQVRHHDLARADSDYMPECTVVYRCHKEYGCCNSTSECGVKTSTYVYRSFYEFTCEPNSNCSLYPVPVVKTFQFVNHTECECKPIKHLPRCLLCPLPFEMGGREEFGRCNCTCDTQHQQCLEISNGVMPLAADEVNCVRESSCERPFCMNGDYDVDTGFCPCPEDSPDCRLNHQGQGQDQNDEDDDDDDEDDEATTEETQTTSHEQPTTIEATNSTYEQP